MNSKPKKEKPQISNVSPKLRAKVPQKKARPHFLATITQSGYRWQLELSLARNLSSHVSRYPCWLYDLPTTHKPTTTHLFREGARACRHHHQWQEVKRLRANFDLGRRRRPGKNSTVKVGRKKHHYNLFPFRVPPSQTSQSVVFWDRDIIQTGVPTVCDKSYFFRSWSLPIWKWRWHFF